MFSTCESLTIHNVTDRTKLFEFQYNFNVNSTEITNCDEQVNQRIQTSADVFPDSKSLAIPTVTVDEGVIPISVLELFTKKSLEKLSFVVTVGNALNNCERCRQVVDSTVAGSALFLMQLLSSSTELVFDSLSPLLSFLPYFVTL
jgi:hypothetical protein